MLTVMVYLAYSNSIILKSMYKHAALGGTFDHFHNGHKRIIDFAFHVADKVSIGIVKQKLLEKKPFQEVIEPFETRKENVLSYVRTAHDLDKTELLQLTDMYGSTLTDETLDSIVVTRESRPNAIKINTERKALGMQPLAIVTIPFVKGEDNKIIRSRRIRGGYIDRSGKSYLSLFNKRRVLNLPPRLRELLRRPLGIIIQGEQVYSSFTAEKVIKWIERNEPFKVITVGDVVSESLLQNKFKPDLQIIDNRTQRKSFSSKKQNKQLKPTYKNPAGTIQRTAVTSLNKKMRSIIDSKKKELLVVQGEEDLLALPAMLLAPLDSIVIYGQANLGVIVVQITEELKYKVEGILRQFE